MVGYGTTRLPHWLQANTSTRDPAKAHHGCSLLKNSGQGCAQDLSAQTRHDGEEEKWNGWARDEVSINVRERRRCLDCKLLLADSLLFYNQRSLLREWSKKGSEKKEREREHGWKKQNSHWRVAKWGKRVTKYCNNLKNITRQPQRLLKIGSKKGREWVEVLGCANSPGRVVVFLKIVTLTKNARNRLVALCPLSLIGLTAGMMISVLLSKPVQLNSISLTLNIYMH